MAHGHMAHNHIACVPVPRAPYLVYQVTNISEGHVLGTHLKCKEVHGAVEVSRQQADGRHVYCPDIHQGAVL